MKHPFLLRTKAEAFFTLMQVSGLGCATATHCMAWLWSLAVVLECALQLRKGFEVPGLD